MRPKPAHFLGMEKKIILILFIISFGLRSEAQEVDNSLIGVWINKAFIEKTKENQSPYNAHLELSKNYYSHVTFDEMAGTMLTLNFHDTIKFTYLNKKLVAENGDSLFEVRISNSELIIRNLLSNKKTHFLKISDDLIEGYDKMSKYVANLCFSGTYLGNDKSRPIIFNEDGTISGMKEYSKYQVGLDFMESTYFNYFYVWDKATNEKSFLGWEKKRNRMEIFEFVGRMIRVEKKTTLYRLKQAEIE